MAVRLLFVPVIFLLVNFRYSYGSRCFYLPKISLQGGTYDEFLADDIKLCCMACAKDSCCIAYTFKNSKCYLKSTVGDSEQTDDQVTSGIKANVNNGQQSLLRNIAIDGAIVSEAEGISRKECQLFCTAFGIYTWDSLLGESSGACSCVSRIASVEYRHGSYAGIFPPV